MKRANLILFNLLITLLLIVPIIPTSAQVNNDYKWLHPNTQGNELDWIKMWDANNWYACGRGTTFLKTSNGGNTWEIRDNYFTYDSLYILDFTDMEFFDMNTGYACGTQGKFYKTTNGGKTWDSMTVLSPSALWTDMYWVDQMTGVLSGFKPYCAAVTTDGGATWYQPGTPPNYSAFSLFAFSKDSIMLCCEQGRISKTTNGGANWESVLAAVAGITLFSADFIDNSTGYVCGTSKTVRMTTNFGSNWTNLNAGLPNEHYYGVKIKTISDTPYVYVTGGYKAIYRAKLGTTAWDTLSIYDTTQTLTSAMIYSDISSTGDTIITCGNYGLINARYGSSHNKAFTNYVTTSEKYDIWSDGLGRIISVGEQDGGNDESIYSTDGGITWQRSNITGSLDNFYGISMVNSTTGYVSGDGTVFKTTTGGTDWFETSSTGINNDLYDVFFLNENTGWTVGQNGKCFKTTNAGNNWISFDWGGGTDDALNCSFINANTGWICGENGKLYKTTDGGATTTSQEINAYHGDIISLDMFSSNTGWITTQIDVRKTTNGGTNWDTVYLPFTDIYPEDLSFADEMNGMILDGEGNVFKTSDGGDSWEAGNLAAYPSSAYMVSPTEAYFCGNYSYIFGYKEVISGTELTYTNSIPKDHYLEQNYPNPFNPSTTIKFGIPRQGLVSLKVYDMSGREVANLINNRKMNAGQVTQRFDGSSLSSGVYFYSLVVDGELIATKKMVLVK